jgi:hypothetical protein
MTKRKGCCRFFNGTVHDKCDAGVNYRQLVGGPDVGWLTRLPCHKKYRIDGYATCDKFTEPNEKEIAESQAVEEESLRHIKAILPYINRMKQKYGWDKPRRRGKRGTEQCPCPVCKEGTLKIEISGTNGHTCGRCSTAGCVNWME